MKILSMDRGQGKTTQAIIESAKTGLPILCMDDGARIDILRKAKMMNTDIPIPMSVYAIQHNPWIRDTEVIIDELDFVLGNLIGTRVHMATLTPSETSNRYGYNMVKAFNFNNEGNKEERPFISNDDIEDVIFNKPATIVKWKDGTKTVVKCNSNDIYNPETGLAMCIVKRANANKGKFNEIFKKWLPNTKQN